LTYRDQNGAVGSSTSGSDSTTIALLVEENRLGPTATPPHTPREKQPATPPSHTPPAPHALSMPPTHAPPSPTPPTLPVPTLPPSRPTAFRNQNEAVDRSRSVSDSTTIALMVEQEWLGSPSTPPCTPCEKQPAPPPSHMPPAPHALPLPPTHTPPSPPMRTPFA